MLAIYKKELKTYFTTMTGYAFVAFFSLVSGFVFYFINVYGRSAFIGHALSYSYISIILMVLVPVLTMKVFADERHSKTDQMLFTAPVSVGSITLGKYLSVCTVFTIPVVVILFYPLIMSDYGDTPIGANYASIFGFWLMGLALFAIGCFISSITENQIISAVATFAILLLVFILRYITKVFPSSALFSAGAIVFLIAVFALIYYLMARRTVKKAPFIAVGIIAAGLVIVAVLYIINSEMFESLIQTVLLHCSIYYMYEYYFSTEIIDIESIVYFISVIVFFLFLTVQSVQKRRWE